MDARAAGVQSHHCYITVSTPKCTKNPLELERRKQIFFGLNGLEMARERYHQRYQLRQLTLSSPKVEGEG